MAAKKSKKGKRKGGATKRHLSRTSPPKPQYKLVATLALRKFHKGDFTESECLQIFCMLIPPINQSDIVNEIANGLLLATDSLLTKQGLEYETSEVKPESDPAF